MLFMFDVLLEKSHSKFVTWSMLFDGLVLCLSFSFFLFLLCAHLVGLLFSLLNVIQIL